MASTLPKSEPVYPETPASPDFPALEQEILTYWQENGIFEKSVQQRAAKTPQGESNAYVFYDGPPFANGLPHHGHLLTGYVKDLFARYHTMKGKRVERRFGWDCHGLPAEMEAEKELGISGRKRIMEYGIDRFNDYCRRSVMQYAGEWEWYVNRQARWVDFAHDYKTMDRDYMESVLWAFKQLYEKGYIYEGFKVMPYSWSAETVLSNAEIRLDDATREKEDKAVTVAFRLKEKPEGAPEADAYYVLAWTTTPWTLPSNLALAVSGSMDYAAIVTPAQAGVHAGHCYLVAAASLQPYAKDLGLIDAQGNMDSGLRRNDVKGRALLGLSYEPLFPYFADTPGAFRILDGSDFIEEGSGTGIVHMAPGFGEDDQRVCAENGIDVVVPVDGEGRYTDAVYDLPDMAVYDAGTAGSQSTAAAGSGDLTDNIAIETERCILRPPTPQDEADFIALHTNPTVMETMNDGVMSEAQAREDFARNLAHFAEHGYGQWVVCEKETGRFMGRAGLSFVAQSTQVEPLPTLRCGLLPDFWHGGYGGEVCLAALHWGFTRRDVPLIAAGALENNPRALAMLQRLGFRHVRDVMFTRMKGPYFQLTNEEYLARNTLRLRGLNVIKETKAALDSEPYTEAQLEKFGLANLRIIHWLKLRGRLIKQEDYRHNYPHCWRTDQPIIYMAMSSWFVDVPQFRERMVELNQRINWIPAHIRDGRFGKWLENAREWSISRSRFWGCPIPVWRSDNPKNNELYVFGSIAELEAFFGPHRHDAPLPASPRRQGEGQEASPPFTGGCEGGKFRITDLHRPYIDELTAPDPHDPRYTIRRVEDVFDCWFESGSMPYAQGHYPFEQTEWKQERFPADFIVEYEAQTRGWFYNMMVLSVALFDDIPFKNCICHGVVLDDAGRKLSKRLKNYMDPKALFERYGADALRWFMMSSSIMRGSELLLDPQGTFIHDAIRLYLKPIWNAWHFFTLYANADGVRAQFNSSPDHVMDRYILAKCAGMVAGVTQALNAYDTPQATQAITRFVEVLNNWYIRRNKERFWNERQDADKQAAYNTLFTVLHILSRTAAPFLPMLSEAVYRGLTGDESVHLADWPDVSAMASESELVADMDCVRDACNTLLSIRNSEKIRIRQPLGGATLYGPGATRLEPFAGLIAEEVNLKQVAFSDALEDVAERRLTIHFPVAGKRLGAKMKAVAAAAKAGDWKLENGTMVVGGEALEEGEYDMQLVPKDHQAGAQALATNDALVVLDLSVTPELEAEGRARDLVRLIQQARKDWGLNVADRIALVIDTGAQTADFIDTHRAYICEQTLAVSLERGDVSQMAHQAAGLAIDGLTFAIGGSVAERKAA